MAEVYCPHNEQAQPGEYDIGWTRRFQSVTCREAQEVATEEFTRRIIPGIPLKLGSAVAGDISISEASLDAEHAQVTLDDAGKLSLIPVGRTYHLLGQTGIASSSHTLQPSTVIKMGACSLCVTSVVKHTDAHSAYHST